MKVAHNQLYLSSCGKKQFIIKRNTNKNLLDFRSRFKWKFVTSTGRISYWDCKTLPEKFKSYELIVKL